MEKKEESVHGKTAWYVLQLTGQREMMAKAVLDRMHIEHFLPTVTVERKVSEGSVWQCVQPAMYGYIFIKTTKAMLYELQQTELPFLHFVTTLVDGESTLLTVPEHQMKYFMALAGNGSDAEYADPADLPLAEGSKVRILGGPFEGIEGIYLHSSQKRNRRVVVQIAHLFAVLTTTVPSEMVETIE